MIAPLKYEGILKKIYSHLKPQHEFWCFFTRIFDISCMGKWAPRLVTRDGYPIFHTGYVKITRENIGTPKNTEIRAQATEVICFNYIYEESLPVFPYEKGFFNVRCILQFILVESAFIDSLQLSRLLASDNNYVEH